MKRPVTIYVPRTLKDVLRWQIYFDNLNTLYPEIEFGYEIEIIKKHLTQVFKTI